MNLQQMAWDRAEFGRDKYQVPNPDRDGPWGYEDTAELFWFRDLTKDMKEELADALVYSRKLREKLQAYCPDINTLSSYRVPSLMAQYEDKLFEIFKIVEQLRHVISDYALDAVTDQEEHWDRFKRRGKV